jgi:hypothetical protein
MALPGDKPGVGPDAYFTPAITIAAPPSVVWSWIVQMGQDRAGLHSTSSSGPFRRDIGAIRFL